MYDENEVRALVDGRCSKARCVTVRGLATDWLEQDAELVRLRAKPDLQSLCKDELESRGAEIEQLRSQLPVGMKHCTIEYLQCEKGHTRLWATNWAASECQQCKIEELQTLIGGAK